MKFGVLAGNSHINARIYDLFGQIDPSDAGVFAKKFKSERDEQRFHTFRELIIGAHLRSHGFNLRYEQNVAGKTPDWVALDKANEVIEILDVVTLHQRRETDIDISASVSRGQIWAGWVTIPADHIYSKIQRKANAYARLISEVRKPYVVCLFGEFTASVDPEEVEHVVYTHHRGLFSILPTLAGLIYCFEESGLYNYSYFTNHVSASYPSRLLAKL